MTILETEGVTNSIEPSLASKFPWFETDVTRANTELEPDATATRTSFVENAGMFWKRTFIAVPPVAGPLRGSINDREGFGKLEDDGSTQYFRAQEPSDGISRMSR